MKTFLKSFLRDESGASAAEYALILAVVGLGIAAAGLWLGDVIQESVCEAASTINSANVAGGADAVAKPQSC